MTGFPLKTFFGHESRVKSVATSKHQDESSAFLVSTGDDATTIIWGLLSGLKLSQLSSLQALCIAVSGHNANPFVVIGGNSSVSIRLWRHKCDESSDMPFESCFEVSIFFSA